MHLLIGILWLCVSTHMFKKLGLIDNKTIVAFTSGRQDGVGLGIVLSPHSGQGLSV